MIDLAHAGSRPFPFFFKQQHPLTRATHPCLHYKLLIAGIAASFSSLFTVAFDQVKAQDEPGDPEGEMVAPVLGSTGKLVSLNSCGSFSDLEHESF